MVEDGSFGCTVLSSIWSKLDLMNYHISVIGLSKFNFSKKLTFIFLAFSACSLAFAFFSK